MEEKRKTSKSCGNRRGTNRKKSPKKQATDSFTTRSYGRSITYACAKAFPEPEHISKGDSKTKTEWRRLNWFAPNQLRHTKATELRKLKGIEAASLVLGHSGIEVTQVYAERDLEQTIELARQFG